jgi:CRP-like cAMP-binding protein
METINQLLVALPLDEYRRVSTELVLSPLIAGQVLQKQGNPVTRVWFLSRNLCSLTMSTGDGSAPEIGMVGSEGVVGLEAALDLPLAVCNATVRVAGDGMGHVMTVQAFRRELDQRGALHSGVRAFAKALLGLATQTAICNALHHVDQRCCRWLLHAQDRLMTSEFPMTQDLLSEMLGVRRPTVSLAVAKFVRLGIISTSRGMLRIVDRSAVEACSCECYQQVTKKAVGQLLVSYRLPSQPNVGPPNGLGGPTFTH